MNIKSNKSITMLNCDKVRSELFEQSTICRSKGEQVNAWDNGQVRPSYRWHLE